jgi:hypothetical protein
MTKLVMGVGIGVFVVSMALGGWTGWKPLNVNVAAANKMILPPVVPRTPAAWTTSTAYVWGNIVQGTGAVGKVYWCVGAGTSSNSMAASPVAVDGDDTADPSVTWRFLRPRRDHLTISNNGTGTVWLAFGGTNAVAVVNSGIRLVAGANWESPGGADCPQGAVTAIGDNAACTNVVGVQED